MSARRTLFVDDKGSKVPLTPTPPIRGVPSSLSADAINGGSNTSSPVHPRNSKQACEDAKLDNPFDHRRTDYHSSQQGSLNAELRTKVERVTAEWERIVQTTRQQIELLPEKASSMNYMSYNGMTAYDEGYGCTEDLPMAEERLISEFRYNCQLDMLKTLQAQPQINVSSIRSSLDNLLNSNKLVPRLDGVIKEITPLDIAAEVQASVSAVALHEKLHYPLAEKLKVELSKNQVPILELEEKVMAEKTLKELALENRDVGQASECLTNQVEASNELLKLNHVRMAMVHMIANEVDEYDKEVSKLLELSSAIDVTMEKNLKTIMEPIQRDVTDCKKDRELAKQQLAATAAAFAKEQADARMRFKEYESKEQRLWKQICDAFTELEMTTSEKKHFVWQRLLAKEKNARQQTIEAELLRAQESHLVRLQMCEDYIGSAQRAASQFHNFIEAFDTALRAQVQKHQEDLHALQLREASEYVRRYELFAFGAEEVRAKKQSRLDVMDLSRRNLMLDIETATNTLDPNVAKYKAEVNEIDEDTSKMTQYLGYLDDMQTERKQEVEPATRYVSAFVAQQRMHQKRSWSSSTPGTAAATTEKLTRGTSSTTPRHATEVKTGVALLPSQAAASAHEDAPPAESLVVEDGELPEVEDEDIVHPQIAARTLGLMHEENVTLRAHDYVREELAAIETRMSDIRRAKNDNEQRMESAKRNRPDGKVSPPLIYIPK